MVNIKKLVLLVQVTLFKFHVMSQVLIVNTNNHCTETKLQEINLNGSNKQKIVFIPSFFFTITDRSLTTIYLLSLRVQCMCTKHLRYMSTYK